MTCRVQTRFHSPALYRLKLWGDVALVRPDGISLLPGARRARALVALLALANGNALARDQLAAFLWPERTEVQARGNLRQLMSDLRARNPAAPTWLEADRYKVSLIRGLCDVDLDRLSQMAAAGNAGELAAELDATDPRLLHDLDGIGDAFDQWLYAERTRAQTRLRDAVDRRAQDALAGGRAHEAQVLLIAWSRFDPTDEAMAVMSFHADARLGDLAGLRRHMASLRVALAAQLDIAPSSTTESAYTEAIEAADSQMPDRARPALQLAQPPRIRAFKRVSQYAIPAGIVTVLAVFGVGLFAAASSKPAASIAANADAKALTLAADRLIDRRTRASYRSAETLLRRAVSRAPTYAPAWAELGLVVEMPAIWSAAGNPAAKARIDAEAIEYVDRALALDPGQARAMAVRGLAVGAPAGVDWLKQSLASNPNDPDAWLWLGNQLIDQERFRDALAAFGQSKALAPISKRSVQAFAELAERMGQQRAADAAVAAFALVSDNLYDALVMKSGIAQARGNLLASAEFAEAALAAAPDDPWKALSPLVEVARATGDGAIARRLLAGHDGMARLYLPLFDTSLVVVRTVSGKAGSDPFIADAARVLVNSGHDSLLLGLPARDDEAPATFQRDSRHFSLALGGSIAVALRRQGRTAEAKALVDQMRAVVAEQRRQGLADARFNLGDAIVSALDGQDNAAIDALARAVSHGWRGQFAIWPRDPIDEPAFAGLKGNVRFAAVLIDFRKRQQSDRAAIRASLARSVTELSRNRAAI